MQTTDEPLLACLRCTVSSALKQWLDDNRAEFLRMAREAILDNNTGQRGGQQPTQSAEFLTVIEVAQRWRLNPETVRRRIRDGRIPSVLVGRHHRVAPATVVEFEKSRNLADT